MAWAEFIGDDLPDRVELALPYKHLPEQFEKTWYCSNEQHASGSYYAWYQHFDDGSQYGNHKDGKLCARSVRRSKI